MLFGKRSVPKVIGGASSAEVMFGTGSRFENGWDGGLGVHSARLRDESAEGLSGRALLLAMREVAITAGQQGFPKCAAAEAFLFGEEVNLGRPVSLTDGFDVELLLARERRVSKRGDQAID